MTPTKYITRRKLTLARILNLQERFPDMTPVERMELAGMLLSGFYFNWYAYQQMSFCHKSFSFTSKDFLQRMLHDKCVKVVIRPCTWNSKDYAITLTRKEFVNLIFSQLSPL